MEQLARFPSASCLTGTVIYHSLHQHHSLHQSLMSQPLPPKLAALLVHNMYFSPANMPRNLWASAGHTKEVNEEDPFSGVNCPHSLSNPRHFSWFPMPSSTVPRKKQGGIKAPASLPPVKVPATAPSRGMPREAGRLKSSMNKKDYSTKMKTRSWWNMSRS